MCAFILDLGACSFQIWVTKLLLDNFAWQNSIRPTNRLLKDCYLSDQMILWNRCTRTTWSSCTVHTSEKFSSRQQA
jgi:hypothetical protein